MCDWLDFAGKRVTDYFFDLVSMYLFLDLSKAFDFVNDGRLLNKLSDYGARGIPLS